MDTELNLYVILWDSFGGRIPWFSGNPKEVAERVSYVIWSYIQEFKESPLQRSDKGSVIGHAALYSKLKRPDGSSTECVFSNTGGNVGFYSIFSSKYPFRYRLIFPPIIACFYVLESLAAHVEDGKWESVAEFRDRVQKRRKPRVRKETLLGDQATRTFELLQQIQNATTSFPAGPGGPSHYGLNTVEVRLVDSFDNPLEMKEYDIAGDGFEIHGGCANAVASVLEAARLSHVVERTAQFEKRMSFSDFTEAALPVVQNDAAFDAHGNARDRDLKRELRRLPSVWGAGDVVRFFDPNYWYDTLPDIDQNYADLKDDLGLL